MALCAAGVITTWPRGNLGFSMTASFPGRMTGFEDLIGGFEDAVGGLLRDGFPLEPVLEVSPGILGSSKTQGFSADQGDAFGFHFPQVAGSDIGVVHPAQFRGMTQKNMGQFVEEGAMGSKGDRRDR